MDRESTRIKLAGRGICSLEQYRTNSDYRTEKQQVFIIGSKGIPANYGGFETFVEKLTEHQVSDRICYHVACIGDENFCFEYNGAKCFTLRVPNIGAAKAIYYDIKALQWCIEYCKAQPAIKQPVFYVLACRIGPFIKRYKKQIEKLGGVLYVNPDGHEWMRRKWNVVIRKYWKISESLMVKYADLLICDSKNIEKAIYKNYEKFSPKTTFIAYGSDGKQSSLADDDQQLLNWYKENGLAVKGYYLVVGRFVPENNFEVMIREFMISKSKKDFAIITTANNKFLKELEHKLHYRGDPRIKFVGTVYNQELLKKIRENAFGYFHGHEVGGTNPSLLEAMSSTDLNLLLNVGFNREVGKDGAIYWNKETGNLAKLIEKADAMSRFEIKELGKKAKRRISDKYSWEYIVNLYENIFLSGVK